MEERIEEYWNTHCESVARCVVDFGDITDQEWDRIFFFRFDATLEEVLQTLGVEWYAYEEFSRKIILMKDGQIVYSE